MKVLIAGATGAIGTPLSRRLIAAGHEVIGLTRTAHGASALSARGVTPVVADAMDRAGLLRATEAVTADAVIHELTALAKPPMRHSGMTQTNRLRTDGTKNLIEMARQVGADTFITQSIVVGYGYKDFGQQVLTEDQPFGRPDSGKCNPHVAAMLENEELVLKSEDFAGMSLRYGLFYGADVANMAAMLRARKLPVAAGRDSRLPWIHHEDAAAATIKALENGRGGETYNIVDDEGASWAEMVTAIAHEFETPNPLALPGWLLRLAAPYAAVILLDVDMQVSNAKAKAELGWKPEYADYRVGLRAAKAAA